MDVIRECNVTVRWLMLQRKTTYIHARKQIEEKLKIQELLELLLKTSQLEAILRTVFEKLIEEK